MGKLIHGPLQIEVDDRTLAHLETVIVNKFRRWESFLLIWLDQEHEEDHRRSLWMTSRNPVYFEYSEGQAQPLDKEWLQRLQNAATGPQGLFVVGEDGAPARFRVRV